MFGFAVFSLETKPVLVSISLIVPVVCVSSIGSGSFCCQESCWCHEHRGHLLLATRAGCPSPSKQVIIVRPRKPGAQTEGFPDLGSP